MRHEFIKHNLDAKTNSIHIAVTAELNILPLKIFIDTQ